MEWLDVVDEKGNPTGELVEREIAHAQGILHRTSHVWLIRKKNGKMEILLQKRSYEKSFPGCYDISSAGHIPAGCGFEESALRELQEELGVTAVLEDLHHCGQRRISHKEEFFGKPFIDEQVSNVYYLWFDTDAEFFQIQPEEFLAQLDDSIDLLILCNPNNPTSSAISVNMMERILIHCKEHDIFVMVDETYVEFAPDIKAISSMPHVKNYDNLMIIRGVSKFFAAPGLRLGYGITSNEAFISVLHTHQNPWTLNSIGAFAGELMMKDSEYIARTRELILSERERIYRELQAIPELHTFEPIANFFLVKIKKEGVTSAAVFDFLIKKGLMIRDCSSFTNLKGEYIRFCIMNPSDNTRLLNGLREYFNMK